MERKPRERRIKLENMEKNVFIPSYISNLPQQWPNCYFLTEILHQILFKVLCSFIFYLNETNWRHRTLLGWGAARLKACHFNQQRIKSSSSMGFRAQRVLPCSEVWYQDELSEYLASYSCLCSIVSSVIIVYCQQPLR